MHNSITWQQWAQQLSAYIEMQKQRIDKLEETVTKLQSDLDAVKVQNDSISIKLNIISTS